MKPFTYELGPLGPDDVEVEVTHRRICHTDLVFLDKEIGMSTYPFVPGHEIVGKVTRLGEVAETKGLSIGDVVGIGWNKESCLHCDPCFEGETHLYKTPQFTILSNHGGFAGHVKTYWHWAIPLPQDPRAEDAGPPLCAGVSVFSPMLENGISPTDTIGVFGIGGLGHLGLQFAHPWGAKVVAFTSSVAKADEARAARLSRIRADDGIEG